MNADFIERIGQEAPVIDIANLRYRGSVEDDVHAALFDRLRQIRDVFGTIPDALEDVWVKTANGQVEEARRRDALKKSPNASFPGPLFVALGR